MSSFTEIFIICLLVRLDAIVPVHVHLERLLVGGGEVAAVALVRRLEAGAVHDHVLRQVALLRERLHTNVASAIDNTLSLSLFSIIEYQHLNRNC